MATINPWPKTLALAAAAGAVVALLLITRPAEGPGPGALSDQGAPLAPDLTDPQKVASLEVIGWDEQAARARAFKVELKDGKWVVPSAFNYPVDATQNMAAAAASFVGALKDRVVTDQPTEHAKLGVIAPDDVASTATTGRGTRVTMRDATGKTVADLIIGGPVAEPAAAPGAPPAKRYVREQGKNRVYTTALNQAYSTRLSDWVQADLLGTTPDQIKKVGVDRYRIDEQKGSIVDVKTLTVTRPEPAIPAGANPPPAPSWSLQSSEGPTPPGAPINQARIDEALTALTSLRIVGGRPKPANLAGVLGGQKGEGQISLADSASLLRHGFFIASSGNLVANEGSLTVSCADGVVYTLWIGELATDEATRDQGAGAATAPADAKSKADGRYMMITVSFDPSLIGEAPVKPAELADLEKQAAALPAGQKLPDEQNARLVNLGAQFKAQSDGYAARVKTGTERAETLAKRFAAWYYVVDATSLDKLRPSREQLLAPAPPAPAAPAPAVIPTPGG